MGRLGTLSRLVSRVHEAPRKARRAARRRQINRKKCDGVTCRRRSRSLSLPPLKWPFALGIFFKYSTFFFSDFLLCSLWKHQKRSLRNSDSMCPDPMWSNNLHLKFLSRWFGTRLLDSLPQISWKRRKPPSDTEDKRRTEIWGGNQLTRL